MRLADPRSLVTSRRLDLAVKWRFFRSMAGSGMPGAEELYRWHIARRSGDRMAAGLPTDKWKRSVDDYVTGAKALYSSMRETGFHLDEPVPVDPAGELLGGAHRVACAIALGIHEIAVESRPETVWAPAWGYEWFAGQGMSSSELTALLADWTEMRAHDAAGAG
jgi:hypothetical protein